MNLDALSVHLAQAGSLSRQQQGELLAEVRWLNRMVEKACRELAADVAGRQSVECWRKYLEEAADNG